MKIRIAVLALATFRGLIQGIGKIDDCTAL
jgi:hypothetical protein